MAGNCQMNDLLDLVWSVYDSCPCVSVIEKAKQCVCVCVRRTSECQPVIRFWRISPGLHAVCVQRYNPTQLVSICNVYVLQNSFYFTTNVLSVLLPNSRVHPALQLLHGRWAPVTLHTLPCIILFLSFWASLTFCSFQLLSLLTSWTQNTVTGHCSDAFVSNGVVQGRRHAYVGLVEALYFCTYFFFFCTLNKQFAWLWSLLLVFFN